MRTIGIILGAVVGGLVLYVVYSLVAGGTANAADSLGSSNTLTRTAGSNAKGYVQIKTPAGVAAVSSGISKADADNLNKYGTSWGTSAAPKNYTSDNLKGIFASRKGVV
jgi:hypothetical protein